MHNRPLSLLLLLPVLAGGCARRHTLPEFVADADTAPLGHAVLRVVIDGARRPEGLIILSLFAEDSGFPLRIEQALRRMEQPVHDRTVEFRLADLPPGRYAVAVLHDENSDRALQTDWLGRPREGYAFSGGARISRGLPGFEDAAFQLDEEESEVRVELIYH